MNYLKIVSQVIPKQAPLQIYKERLERMKLVSIAPLIFIMGLYIIYLVVLYVDKGSILYINTIGDGLFLSSAWFLIVGYFIRHPKVKNFLKNQSTLFRFLFDLPFLLINLLWIIYC